MLATNILRWCKVDAKYVKLISLWRGVLQRLNYSLSSIPSPLQPELCRQPGLKATTFVKPIPTAFTTKYLLKNLNYVANYFKCPLPLACIDPNNVQLRCQISEVGLEPGRHQWSVPGRRLCCGSSHGTCPRPQEPPVLDALLFGLICWPCWVFGALTMVITVNSGNG